MKVMENAYLVILNVLSVQGLRILNVMSVLKDFGFLQENVFQVAKKESTKLIQLVMIAQLTAKTVQIILIVKLVNLKLSFIITGAMINALQEHIHQDQLVKTVLQKIVFNVQILLLVKNAKILTC